MRWHFGWIPFYDLRLNVEGGRSRVLSRRIYVLLRREHTGL